MTRSTTKRQKPAANSRIAGALLGRLVGLFTACVVTLVGVVRGLDPDAILVRAVVAGLVMGMTASLAHQLIMRLGAE